MFADDTGRRRLISTRSSSRAGCLLCAVLGKEGACPAALLRGGLSGMDGRDPLGVPKWENTHHVKIME